MRDLLLQCAGVVAIARQRRSMACSARPRCLPRATIEPPRLRTLMRLVWQAGTVAWIAGGVLLIAAPWMGSDAARHWIIVTFAVVFALRRVRQRAGRRAAVISAGSRMSAVVALAVAGY